MTTEELLRQVITLVERMVPEKASLDTILQVDMALIDLLPAMRSAVEAPHADA